MPVGRSIHIGVVAALFCAVALVGAQSPSQAHAAGCSFGSGWGAKKPALAKQVVTQVNAYRSRRGLSRLVVNPQLTKAAEWKAGHMARFNYFAHNDRAGANRSPAQRLSACGYRGGTWGENLAFGFQNAGAAMTGWINSSGHRANLENPRFTAIGVGVVARGGGSVYWAQSFGVGGPTRKAAAAKRRAVVSRVSRLGPQQQQMVKFDMARARRGRLVVRPMSGRGARSVSVRLHCNHARIARSSGRRGKSAVIARRIPRGRCAAMVQSGRRAVKYKITLVLYS